MWSCFKVSDVLRGRGTRSCIVKPSSNGRHPSKITKVNVFLNVLTRFKVLTRFLLSCLGSLSPGSSNNSPRMTPTFQGSASLSPVTPVLPRSQSADSISERQSPMISSEKTLQTLPLTHHNVAVDNRAGYGMALHHFPSFLLPPGYDPLGKPNLSHIQSRMLIADYPFYYPTGIQTHPCYSEAQIILFPSFPVPVTYGSPPQGAVSQSRPSSRSSDQSDMSAVSVNNDERFVS